MYFLTLGGAAWGDKEDQNSKFPSLFASHTRGKVPAMLWVPHRDPKIHSAPQNAALPFQELSYPPAKEPKLQEVKSKEVFTGEMELPWGGFFG